MVGREERGQESPGTDAGVELSAAASVPRFGGIRARSVRRHQRFARGCPAGRVGASGCALEQHREREHAGLQALGRELRGCPAGCAGQREPLGLLRRLGAPHDRDAERHHDARRRQQRRHRPRERRAGEDDDPLRERDGHGGQAPARPVDPDQPGPLAMGIFGALDTSASGLTAERLRMDVIANNLANANTTRGADGTPYKRQEVVLQERGNGFSLPTSGTMASGAISSGNGAGDGVEVAGVVNDTSPPRMVYDPGHPDANAQGYVQMPNVNPVTEMTDLITATRAYEANTTAINAVKSEAQHALDVLR